MDFLSRVTCLVLFVHVACELSRIGDGLETEEATKFPFFAQLVIPVYETNHYRGCGASLIHPRWILTAGHCFPNDSQKFHWIVSQDVPMVFMGSAKRYCKKAQTNSLEEIHRHPNFSWFTHNEADYIKNDIAIAKLKIPYMLSATIQTIDLSLKFGQCRKGTVIGVGRTKLHSSCSSNFVKYADELPLKTFAELTRTVEDQTRTTFYTENSVWKNDPSSGYALPGDSGGPFVCQLGNVRFQVGVTSKLLGPNFANSTVINVYERVDSAIEFIAQHVKLSPKKFLLPAKQTKTQEASATTKSARFVKLALLKCLKLYTL